MWVKKKKQFSSTKTNSLHLAAVNISLSFLLLTVPFFFLVLTHLLSSSCTQIWSERELKKTEKERKTRLNVSFPGRPVLWNRYWFSGYPGSVRFFPVLTVSSPVFRTNSFRHQTKPDWTPVTGWTSWTGRSDPILKTLLDITILFWIICLKGVKIFKTPSFNKF